MSGEKGKTKEIVSLIWAVVAAVLLCTGGFALAVFRNVKLGGISIELLKGKQPAKSDQENSDKQQQQNPPAKSDEKNSDQNKDKEQDTRVDDDPE